MSDAAKIFADDWYERGDENGDCQIFWMTLLRDVFAVENPERLIKFQKPVAGKHIDAYIARTKVLIEQKSFGVDLTKKILQSDGEPLTAFEQAARYAKILPADEKPRWIVTCNFSEFRIYNVAEKIFEREPVVIKLRDLRYQFRRLEFLIDPTADTTPPEEKISAEATRIIEKICETFDKNYRKRKDKIFRDALSKLCTRLVFCFYADDSGLFSPLKFVDYLKNFSVDELNDALQKFFAAINTPRDCRKNFDDALKNFPYVNGGLFDERLNLPPLNQLFQFEIEHAHDLRRPSGIPRMDAEQKNFLKFSWREIDPPVFGAMFESVVGTQREGGMYYTSLENIHKVIDPLFFDDLRDEFDRIKHMRKVNRVAALKNFQDKLAAIKIFDPACGSGNFLTESYMSLRRLENEILEELRGMKVTLAENPIKVSINQFYGIEIEPFAAAVAQTALWIAENQMLQQTEGAIGKDLTTEPIIKARAKIIRGNALHVDWKTVAPNVDYIIGNPPYVGYSMQSAAQKADMRRVYADNPKAGKIDYVAAWYRTAAEFIAGTEIRCAFLSTNSVCQGEQCADVWKILHERFGIHIDFAHRTFKWESDSDNMAHVHCVVVGFSCAPNPKPKKIFDDKKVFIAENINAYLVDGENIFVESRNKPLQADVPKMTTGNRPADGGNLIIEADDLDYFLQYEPAAKKFIKRLIGSEEFINGKPRYCLWLKDVPVDDWKTLPLVAERVELCRQDRLNGAADRQKLAATPHLFRETKNPARCVVVPKVSSERRQYIPMNFVGDETILTDLLFIIPDAEIYHFGILTSSIHMAWTRTVCGRLKSDYRYSAKVVYNNFPWPDISARRRRMIEESAQKILDVRADFPTWTFAALYDEQTMPDELRVAHRSNDYAVAIAYGFEKFLDDEPKVVAELMKLYQRLATR